MSNPNKTLEREKMRKRRKIDERGFRDPKDRDAFAAEYREQGYLVRCTSVRVGAFRTRQYLYVAHVYEASQ